MTTATATTKTPQTARKGFPGIKCPLCGTSDIQTLMLDDLTTFHCTSDIQTLMLDDLTTFHCTSCEEDYSADDLRELVAAWQRVLAWIDAAPSVND